MLQASLAVPLQVIPEGSRVEVFQRIYWVFLALGTLVGVVVIGYMLYNAYKYRDDGGEDDVEDRPELGELPTGGGKGRKLFLSFTLSAIIVVSLVVWTYGTLLYVENAAAGDSGIEGEDPVDVRVEGYQFNWSYHYENGHEADVLRIPEDRTVRIHVTSTDVWHNYGVPEFRVKTDAIPGQWTQTWFIAEDPGRYTAKCYELCGSAHSFMEGPVVVMEQDEFEEWYDSQEANPGNEFDCPDGTEEQFVDCGETSENTDTGAENGGEESLTAPTQGGPASTTAP